MQSYPQSRPLHRLMRRMASTRLMARIYAVIQTPLDLPVYRLTHGSTTASSWLGGLEITMLTTTGAKPGSTRTSPVLCIPDGEDSILIASNYGRPHNPSWYYNLRAHPYATIASAEPAVRSWPRSSAGMTASAATGVARRSTLASRTIPAGRRVAGSRCSG